MFLLCPRVQTAVEKKKKDCTKIFEYKGIYAINPPGCQTQGSPTLQPPYGGGWICSVLSSNKTRKTGGIRWRAALPLLITYKHFYCRICFWHCAIVTETPLHPTKIFILHPLSRHFYIFFSPHPQVSWILSTHFISFYDQDWQDQWILLSQHQGSSRQGDTLDLPSWSMIPLAIEELLSQKSDEVFLLTLTEESAAFYHGHFPSGKVLPCVALLHNSFIF